jgi:hypothetical protein
MIQPASSQQYRRIEYNLQVAPLATTQLKLVLYAPVIGRLTVTRRLAARTRGLRVQSE